MPVYIGLDIGGTKILSAATDVEGNLLRCIRANTPEELDQGLILIKNMVAETAAGDEILAIGAAIGGPLDWQSGIVSPLHQPKWRNIPLKGIIESEFNCPFHVDVDTNVAAMGEYHAIQPKPKRMLYITISTGMGGGWIVDGEIYRGLDQAHPEIAHQAIPFRCAHPERVICECGLRDCLEALVSGNGIQRIYGKAAENLDPLEWDEIAFNLGQGLRNLATILLPDLIVLGGGVALGGGEHLLNRAVQVMSENLRLIPIPQVRTSELGYDTALVGATTIARTGLQ